MVRRTGRTTNMRPPRPTTFVTGLLGLFACSPDAGITGEVARPIPVGSRPNVIVVMADDLDERTMQTLFALDLAPNIERYLVDEGTVCSRSFVSHALCCPSRATVLAGLYSHDSGVLSCGAVEPDGGVDALDDTSTLVTWLQAAGYRTGHVGKYLNGYGSRHDTTTPSFQWNYVPPGWDHWQ